MIKRIYTELTRQLLDNFAVCAVLGARQVGKTTLCRQLIKQERIYINLDDISTLSLALDQPEVLINREGSLTIDEIQRAPDLLLAIKKSVDSERKAGKYLITGSANISMLPKIQETLAGRVALLEMWPITFYEHYGLRDKPGLIDWLTDQKLNEIKGKQKLIKKINLHEEILRGFYPELKERNDQFFTDHWYNSYIKTYLERDIREIKNIHSIGDFQKLLTLSAFRIGTNLNKNELAREIGISNVQLSRFWELLKLTYQFFELNQYYRNIGKRLVKTPKIYAYDPGLAVHLMGIRSFEDMERFNKSGALIENKIISDIRAILSVYLPEARLYYYKSHGGGEIDMIIEFKDQLFPIEVKAGEKIRKINTKTLDNFKNNYHNQVKTAVILYTGEQTVRIRENIFLVPWQNFLI